MPTNITSPNSAKFTIQFTDILGNPTSPTSAAITLNYLYAGALTSSTADLTLVNGYWTYTWSSVGVDVPSNVFWNAVSSLSSPNVAVAGTLRIIDP